MVAYPSTRTRGNCIIQNISVYTIVDSLVFDLFFFFHFNIMGLVERASSILRERADFKEAGIVGSPLDSGSRPLPALPIER